MANEDTAAVREVLVRARALIEERGWIQGSAGDERGYCSLGAIVNALGSQDPGARHPTEASLGAIRTLASVASGDPPYLLAEVGILRVQGIVIDWNDAPGRTQEQVLRAFDVAIARCGPGPKSLALLDGDSCE